MPELARDMWLLRDLGAGSRPARLGLGTRRMLPQCGCPPSSLAWLTHGLLLAGHRAREARKGFAQLEVAVPSSPVGPGH